jgi:FkbM family methyltransferase
MFPHSIVVSLEPSSENFALLQKNTQPFSNIVPLNRALLGSSRTATLSDRGTGEWGLTLLSSTLERRQPTSVETVSAICIDDILSEYGVSGIDILKLDIEGSEKEVLSHSASWMPRVELLTVELHDRIVSGCSAAHDQATVGMRRVGQNGEKVISVRNDVALSQSSIEGRSIVPNDGESGRSRRQ